MANMNFGVNILPKVNNTYTLGNSDYKWNIYANSLNGINLSNIITDIQINNTSILNNNIANIPISSWNTLGVIKTSIDYGLAVLTAERAGIISIQKADTNLIKAGENVYKPLVPYNQHESIFYGLSKLAGMDLAQDSEVVLGTYPSTSKVAICSLIGAAPTDNPVFTGSISLGRMANSTIGSHSFAVGTNVVASALQSHAEGYSTQATALRAHAEGDTTIAAGNYSHAEGSVTLSSGKAAHAEGSNAIAEGNASHAEGSYTRAFGDYSHVSGRYNVADGYSDNALWPSWQPGTNYSIGDRIYYIGTGQGYECTIANNDETFVLANWRPVTEMNYAEIIGNGTADDSRSNARALDWLGNERLMGDLYVGCNADSTGGVKVAVTVDPVFINSISLGRKANTTVGMGSIALGYNVVASGQYSFATGCLAQATTHYAHSEGLSTKAAGMASHAEGNGTTASANAAHAEGNSSIADGECSHVEGYHTKSNGAYSHVGGIFNAIDDLPNLEGWIGGTSYAIGDKVKRNGTSYVCNTANSDSSFDSSKWTIDIKRTYAEIIGNGTDSNARSNARTLDWKGNEHLKGDVYINCNSDSTGGTALGAAIGNLSSLITANESSLTSLEQDENGIYRDVSYTSTTGSYINYYGALASTSGWSYTDPIAVNAGDIVEIYAKGYAANVCMIATTDSTGSSYTPQTISPDSTLKSYFYTCIEDGYIACSFHDAEGCKITIRKKLSNKALDARVDSTEQSALVTDALAADSYLNVIAQNVSSTIGQAGKFIQFNNSLMSNDPFNLSTEITLPANSTIKVYARGYQTNVAIIARSNGDGTYTALVNSIDSQEHVYQYTTYDAINVVLSSNRSTNPIYSIYSSKIDELDSKMDTINDDLFAFSSLGIIGDSLASGASNHSGGTTDRPNYSWGKFIERMYGVRTSLFTIGGMTTQSWLTSSHGLAALNAEKPLDCYIICLGQNDSYSLGDNYLGTISDINVGSEDQNGDTYYGNYSKIIAAIKTKSPNAKIFCLTTALPSNETKINYNTAVRTIVPLYTNTYLVDLAADTFYTSSVFNNLWYGAHSTAAGYKVIAKNIHDNIVAVMRQNISDFLDIQWINNDETGVTEMLPLVTSTDNGKFLRVVNGAWAAATVPSASEVSF